MRKEFVDLLKGIMENEEAARCIMGSDSAAALAKAQEFCPDITAAELAEVVAKLKKTLEVEGKEFAKFIDKMMNDNVFSARVESVESNEEVYNIAKEVVDLPKEDFLRCLNGAAAMANHYSQNEQSSDNKILSEEDLEMVSGGASFLKSKKFWRKYASVASKLCAGVAAAAAVTGVGAPVAAAASGCSVAWGLVAEALE